MQDGWSALHHASLTGHADEVAALVERGASTAVEDNAGYIPLQYAAANQHIEVVHYLLQKLLPTEHLLKDSKACWRFLPALFTRKLTIEYIL